MTTSRIEVEPIEVEKAPARAVNPLKREGECAGPADAPIEIALERTEEPESELKAAMGARAFSKPADIDEFVAAVERFQNGEMTPDQFRAFRLVRGVYGQRQDDVQMLRIKIPGGALLPEQMIALADVALETPRQVGHVTTRQNFQFHFVKLDECERHLRRLEEVGLTTRGACGNAVRNVTGCGRAGLCAGEAFDTTPFSDAITRHFLRRNLAEGLPRKFKIALSGCANDCAMGAINDIGLIAHRAPDGSRRFRVNAAGGLSTLPMSGFLLHESYPAERICEVAEALVRVFDRTGNRSNRSRARVKFVVRKMGEEGFIRMYQEELAKVIASGEVKPLQISDDRPEAPGAWTLPPFANPRLAAFARRNVSPTRNVGRVFVTIKLPIGDITAVQMYGIARLMRDFGDHTARTTVTQNLMLRDVEVSQLPELFRELDEIGLATPDADTSADVTSCPGADSCKLAITTSKDLARELTRELHKKPGSVIDDVSIKLSGCPNSCGQHHVATIGLHGGVRKINGRAAPQYIVMVGGGIDANGAQFGKVAGKVPARRALVAIERLLGLAMRSKAPDESAEQWLRNADQSVLKAELLDLTELGEKNATEQDFIDVGADAPFLVVEMEGECAA